MLKCLKPALTTVAALVLSSCAAQGPDTVLTAMKVLVGAPKEVILSCAGVPARTATIDNQEWFTYHTDNIQGYAGGWTGFGPHWRFGNYQPPEIASQSCEATFTFRDHRVARLDFASPQAIVGNPECAAIVATCVAQTPSNAIIVTPGPGLGQPPPPLPTR